MVHPYKRQVCHFNPRPPWGGRRPRDCFGLTVHSISIHALRGEGDAITLMMVIIIVLFQSTPSVGRATSISCSLLACISVFQSTPSVGRATIYAPLCYRLRAKQFQSTPSVGRATPSFPPPLSVTFPYFNPRPPWGGRLDELAQMRAIVISIHALRGEGDFRRQINLTTGRNFNPRPPWGGRPTCDVSDDETMSFQSTPSVGRATWLCAADVDCSHFNPRPPWGGRLSMRQYVIIALRISIHALRGEGDARANEGDS